VLVCVNLPVPLDSALGLNGQAASGVALFVTGITRPVRADRGRQGESDLCSVLAHGIGALRRLYGQFPGPDGDLPYGRPLCGANAERAKSSRRRCCARDGVGPPGTALQGEVPNHRKLCRLNGRGSERCGKGALRGRQGRAKKANVNKLALELVDRADSVANGRREAVAQTVHLRVVRGDDHEVRGGERPRDAAGVRESATEQTPDVYGLDTMAGCRRRRQSRW
jgi:hypothetical protein